MCCLHMDIARLGEGVKTLAQMVWGTFLSMSKWAISCFRGGVRTLARMVYEIFSSIRQCQKTSRYPFTKLNIVYLMHILIAGRLNSYLGHGHIHKPLFKKGSPLSIEKFSWFERLTQVHQILEIQPDG